MQMGDIDIPKPEKKVVWRLNAPSENWRKFDHEIKKLEHKSMLIFDSESDDIDRQYGKLTKAIETAARISLGKTTLKNKKNEIITEEIKTLRTQKRQLKNLIKEEKNDRQELVSQYKEVQRRLRDEILAERTKRTNLKLERIVKDKSRKNFWSEIKKLGRNHTNECLTVKNESTELFQNLMLTLIEIPLKSIVNFQ